MKITIKNMHQNNQDNNKQIIQKRDDNTKKSRNSQGKYITYSPNIDNLMMNLNSSHIYQFIILLVYIIAYLVITAKNK